jgi:hypothetical protein
MGLTQSIPFPKLIPALDNTTPGCYEINLNPNIDSTDSTDSTDFTDSTWAATDHINQQIKCVKDETYLRHWIPTTQTDAQPSDDPEATNQTAQSDVEPNSNIIFETNFNIHTIDKHKLKFKKLTKKLETTLKLYLLFDNYEIKNDIIIKDLEKKLINQNKEVKNLSEDKDRVKYIIQFNKSKIKKSNTQDKIYIGLNIVLLIVIVILSIINAKKLIPYFSKNLTK